MIKKFNYKSWLQTNPIKRVKNKTRKGHLKIMHRLSKQKQISIESKTGIDTNIFMYLVSIAIFRSKSSLEFSCTMAIIFQRLLLKKNAVKSRLSK